MLAASVAASRTAVLLTALLPLMKAAIRSGPPLASVVEFFAVVPATEIVSPLAPEMAAATATESIFEVDPAVSASVPPAVTFVASAAPVPTYDWTLFAMLLVALTSLAENEPLMHPR